MPQVNLLAVLACGVIAMFIGGLWYSGLLFGNTWMKLAGITKKDVDGMSKSNMWVSYLLNFIAALVMAFVLSNVSQYGGVITASQGAVLGFFMWLGFVGTSNIGMVLWERKSWKLWFINNAYHIVTLCIMGAVLAAFPATK